MCVCLSHAWCFTRDDEADREAVVREEALVVLLEGHQHVLGRVQRLRGWK
jgi:hypothetical protein